MTFFAVALVSKSTLARGYLAVTVAWTLLLVSAKSTEISSCTVASGKRASAVF